MNTSGESTSSDCLRAAFQAILRGDYAERDRLCERAKKLEEAERYAHAVEKIAAVDFYVTPLGIAIPTTKMMKAAKVYQ